MPRNFARNLNRHSNGSDGRYREDDDSRYAQANDERAVLESEDEVPGDVEETDPTVSEARARQRSQQ